MPEVRSSRQRGGSALQEGVDEILQNQRTIDQIKSTLLFFLTAGFGVGIAGFSIVGSDQIRGFMVPIAIIALALIGPVLGALAATNISSALSDEPAIQAYAATGVSTIAGHVLFFIVAFILIAANTDASLAVSDFLVPILIGAIGTGVTGIAAAYTAR